MKQNWWKHTKEVAEFTLIEGTILVGVSSSKSRFSTTSSTITTRWEAWWFEWWWWTVSTSLTSFESSTTSKSSTTGKSSASSIETCTSIYTRWKTKWWWACAETGTSRWWLEQKSNWMYWNERERERTYDIFDDTSGTSLLNECAGFEEWSSVLLDISLWVSLSDTESLELTDNTNLNWFILDDDVTWSSISLSSSSTLNDCFSFSLSTIWNPSFDDNVTYIRLYSNDEEN